MACRVFPAATVAVPTVPLPADQVLDGAPATGTVEFPGVDGLEVGVWEHTAGSSTDVEVDEVFVVLRGRATIEVEGGPELQVGPGDLGLLEAGSRTRWHVHEPLRKVYVAAAGD
jgi:uncharacterized protein